MSDRNHTTRVFGLMVREEWRLHAELFGRRFGAFPLLITAFSAGGFWLLTFTGTSLETVAAGVHALVFFFGLQTGTIGLVGRDAFQNAVGDVTMLLFSARTLPVSWRRLLAVFVVKDLCYYSALFLLPLAVGYGAVVVASGTGAAGVGLLWATVTATFGLGAATSLTLVAVGTRSRLLFVLVDVALPVALVGAVLWSGFDPVRLTPYAVFRDPALTTALVGLTPTVALGIAGLFLLEPAESSDTRTGRTLYPRVRSLLGADRPVAARTVLEVVRSSGSVWKVLFSMGLLFGVAVLLVGEVSRATGLSPSRGIAVGTFLGLGAFTTFSWTTLYDDATEYLQYPMPMSAVFAGKRRAYLVLAVPAGGVYLALAVLWLPLTEVLVAAVLFPLVAVYVFGVTAYVAGLAPNELLFDTPLFALFGAALAVVAVPLVTAALARPAWPTLAVALSIAVGVVAAVVGWILSMRAGPRWGTRIRRGD